MKQKLAILNISLMLTVLLAILFQSLHSFEHFVLEDENVATFDPSKKDVHTDNHSHKKCFVCEFTFSSFVSSEFTSFELGSSFEAIAYTFSYNESPSFFIGSATSLRGPPYSA
jgi:hypothetical protein